MRILVDFEVPPEAIAVLGKGLGFVPTPQSDTTELRLDARRATNKITQFANKLERSSQAVSEDAASLHEDLPSENMFSLPNKLRKPNYFQTRMQSTDPEMIMAVQHLTVQANGFKKSKSLEKKLNLSSLALQGLRWIQTKSRNGEISICKADKGGATLIPPPPCSKGKWKKKF